MVPLIDLPVAISANKPDDLRGGGQASLPSYIIADWHKKLQRSRDEPAS
jgi:hypothetical protein